MKFLVCLLFLATLSCVYSRNKNIEIPGFKPITCTGERILECRHVPYAEYPFRFEPAKPLKPWLNYTYDYFLTMDIFTKKINEEKPVIVALLQENLEQFELTHVPRIMLKKVIFVSLRYRSGLYGFLSTGTEEIRGNEALFDIITALKWIQEYIFYFGGDPEKITLMGLEDSGALVHALAISPNCPKGLFHQIIIGETTAFTPRLTTNDPVGHAIEIALEAGCDFLETTNNINNCLFDPTINLAKLTRSCRFKENRRTIHSPIKLTIGDFGNLLPEHPLLLAQNTKRHYPVLMSTSQNTLRKVFDELLEEDDFVNFSPHQERIITDAVYILKKLASPEISDKWIDFLHNRVSNMTGNYSNRTIYKTVIKDLIGILDSKYPLIEAAKYNSPTYMYFFNYDFPSLYSNQLGFMELPSYQAGSPQDKAFRSLIKIWTTFAETGKPPDTMYNLYDEWPAVGNFNYPYLKLGQYSYIGDDFKNELLQASDISMESEEDVD